MTKLSVIVPCYNCERTIEQTVLSIFRQQPVFPFDVTMVDDGSTDATYAKMQELARAHRGVTLLRHERNLGGGAARNTAVANSDGDLVLCVDGDDILGPGLLEKMTRFWSRKRCDGVGMSTSIKFQGDSVDNIAYVTEFEATGRAVQFESFLAGDKNPLEVVFMLTRAAFDRVGGYPTEHGFDTQGMGFRFLCHGLAAYVCPEAVYYHRVGLPRSYYKREQLAGKINWNWFNILDEFIYLFSDETKSQLLQHDLFELPGKPAPEELLRIVRGARGIYDPHHKRLLRMGPDRVAREFAHANDPFKQYWLGNFHRLKKNHAKALAHYSRAIGLGFNYRSVFFRMLQAELSLAGSTKAATEALEDLMQYSRPFPVQQRPWRQRLFHSMMALESLRGPAQKLKQLWDRVGGGQAR